MMRLEKQNKGHARRKLVGIVIGAIASVMPMTGCETVPGTYESANQWNLVSTLSGMGAMNPDLTREQRIGLEGISNYAASQAMMDHNQASTERLSQAIERQGIETERLRQQVQQQAYAQPVQPQYRQVQPRPIKINHIDTDNDSLVDTIGIDYNMDEVIDETFYLGPIYNDETVLVFTKEGEELPGEIIVIDKYYHNDSQGKPCRNIRKSFNIR